MKTLPDILWELRHAHEQQRFAVLDPEEAKTLLDRFERRTALLGDARSAIFADADVHDVRDTIDEELKL